MALLKRKRVGLNDPMSVVTRFVNACNRHDADEVFACLHPSFDSIQPMYPGRNFRGADQVRRNWQAIFDAEPGFRLTVLRSAVQDDIAWLELHGAGEDAEVAGVFVMGIQGDRIRWARIYSALVDPVVAADGAATVQPVPTHDGRDAAHARAGEEAAIAPVVDIDRPSRRRRRRSRGGDEPAETPAPEAAVAETPVPDEPAAEPAAGTAPEPAAEPAAGTVPEPVAEPAEPEPAPQPEVVADPVPVVVADRVADAGTDVAATTVDEPAVVPPPEAEPDVDVVPAAGGEPEPEPEVLVAPGMTAEPEPPAEVTAAHDMVSELATGEQRAIVVDDAEPEAAPSPAPTPDPEPDDDDSPGWRFGKKSR